MRRRNSACECEVNKTLHFDNATVSINNEAWAAAYNNIKIIFPCGFTYIFFLVSKYFYEDNNVYLCIDDVIMTCGHLASTWNLFAHVCIVSTSLERAREKYGIVRGSSSFVINADSCIVRVQGFIYFTLTFRISPPHLTSLGTVFFLIPQLLLRRRSARCARLPPAQSEGRIIVSCLLWWVFPFPPKKFRQERGFDFLDRRTDGQTDRWTDRQTDRNFVEILGKLCFARLKLNLKTQDRFKLKTKLGYHTDAA